MEETGIVELILYVKPGAFGYGSNPQLL